MANKVFRLQKRCIRIMAGASRREHCKPLFKKFKILTLQDQYILDCACFVKANIHMFNDNMQTHFHQTRNHSELKVCKTNLSVAHAGVRNAMIRIYNKVPEYIKRSSCTNHFKKALKNILLNSNFYNVEDF